MYLKKFFCTFTISIFVIFLFLNGCSENQSSVTAPSDEEPNIAYIYLDNVQQVISGFGGVSMPGWQSPSGGDLGLTSDNVNTAFGADTGKIGLSILRIRVPYDSSLFALEVPGAKAAKSLGALIIASPWTPPAWMKTNNNIVGGSLNDNAYAAYAAHLKAFADYMSANDVPLYAISVQNEPDVTVNYESCHWNAAQMLRFVKDFAPAVGIKIIADESSGFNHTITDAILNNPAAASNVSIIGGHIYSANITSYPLAAGKSKELWMTEHLNTNTDWGSVLGTAREIHGCMDAGMNAYLWWYIRRFYGPLDEDGSVSKRGYVMSQFAWFVRPGFIKLKATPVPQKLLYVTAFKKDSKTVIVVTNASGAIDQTFTFRNGTANSFTPYVTTVLKNCVKGNEVSVTNGSFTFNLEDESVTTFVSN